MSVCIFVALYLFIFVTLYLCMFGCLLQEPIRLKVLWVDAYEPVRSWHLFKHGIAKGRTRALWDRHLDSSQFFRLLLRLQYVAQYPDGTSIRTLKTKTQFLRRPLQLSVNKVFRMKAEQFGFNMKVLASWKLAKKVTEDADLFRWINISWLIITLFTVQ